MVLHSLTTNPTSELIYRHYAQRASKINLYQKPWYKTSLLLSLFWPLRFQIYLESDLVIFGWEGVVGEMKEEIGSGKGKRVDTVRGLKV